MSGGGFNLSDYNTVPERMTEAHAKYPSGSFQSDIVELPAAFADKFIAVKARFFRTPDDPTPGEGLAWELVPGKTPYTKDSELQNAETSAWGRALIAAFAADAKKGIASQEEVRNRQEAPTRSRRGSRNPDPAEASPSESAGEPVSEPVDSPEALQASVMRAWVKNAKTSLVAAYRDDKELARKKYEEILRGLKLDPTMVPAYSHKDNLDQELDVALASIELESAGVTPPA